MRLFGKGFAGLGLMAVLLVAGCKTNGGDYPVDPLAKQTASPADPKPTVTASTEPTPAAPTSTTLHKGDALAFSFADTPTQIMPMEDVIKEDGTVTLIYNEAFLADGKTIGQLQQDIRDRYVPKYFKYLTVTVKTPERFYYVGGEVRAPNRFVYAGRLTVLTAIDTAGGFTEFARKGKVQVTRTTGKTFNVDCRAALAHPEQNVEIYAGDKINVPKRLW